MGKETESVVNGLIRVTELIGNPYLILIFFFMLFLMVIIYMEKKEKKLLLTETLDDLTDQIDILADEIKASSDALVQLTILFQTLSLLKGKGEEDDKKRSGKGSGISETKGKKDTSKDIPN